MSLEGEDYSEDQESMNDNSSDSTCEISSSNIDESNSGEKSSKGEIHVDHDGESVKRKRNGVLAFIIVVIGIFGCFLCLFLFVLGLIVGKFVWSPSSNVERLRNPHEPDPITHTYGWSTNGSVGVVSLKKEANDLSLLGVKLYPIGDELSQLREYRCNLNENIDFENYISERRSGTMSHDYVESERRYAIALALAIQSLVLFVKYALFSTAIYVFAKSSVEAVEVVMNMVDDLDMDAEGHEDDLHSVVEENINCEPVKIVPQGVIFCFGKCSAGSDVRCEEDGLKDINAVKKYAETKYEVFCKAEAEAKEGGPIKGIHRSHLVEFICLKFGESPARDMRKCFDL